MDKKIVGIIIGVCVLLLGGGVVLVTCSSQPIVTGLDDFAKCITESGAIMYGSAGCSYCLQTKKTFGASFQYITYVECPQNPQVCLEKGIDGYPTWIMGDGTKLEGYRDLSELSSTTSCPISIN